jgi:hypothetical protein
MVCLLVPGSIDFTFWRFPPQGPFYEGREARGLSKQLAQSKETTTEAMSSSDKLVGLFGIGSSGKKQPRAVSGQRPSKQAAASASDEVTASVKVDAGSREDTLASPLAGGGVSSADASIAARLGSIIIGGDSSSNDSVVGLKGDAAPTGERHIEGEVT